MDNPMNKRLLFIDRDGTILMEPPDDYQVDSFEKFSFLPGAITNLVKINAHTNFDWIMVTNQDGLGTNSFPEHTFWGPQNMMLDILEKEGIEWNEIHIDRSFAAEQSENRKPNIGAVRHLLEGEYDLSKSYVIGDRITDMLFAHRLGAKGIMIGESIDQSDNHMAEGIDLSNTIVLITDHWSKISDFLLFEERKTSIRRKTKETDIEILINLDGSGKSEIDTGLGFFDHMLDQLAKHSSTDLKISIDGDLHIDEHHTIEDCALALGEGFLEALGNKLGIERYGFCLPMDEAEAKVSIDFGGRPYLVWNAEFKREKIGDMPTEMFKHFFKSFSDQSKCTLHIEVTGENEHHKIEGIFKAFAKAIKMAKNRDRRNLELPSTKGVL